MGGKGGGGARGVAGSPTEFRMEGAHFSALTLPHGHRHTSRERPQSPDWPRLPPPNASTCPRSPAPARRPGAPAGWLGPRRRVPGMTRLCLPHSPANHRHHPLPHMVIAGMKELESENPLIWVNEKVGRRELGKSKIMGDGGKVPLGASRKVLSLLWAHSTL